MTTHQKTAETQAKILNMAEAQFLQNGYSAMSLGVIASGLKLSPLVVQEYFPTKADLGLAIINRARRRFKKWKKLPDQLNSTPYFKLVNFTQLYDNHHLQDQRMGYVVAASASKQVLPKNLLQEINEFAAEQHQYVSKVLKAGKEKESLKFRGKAKAKAAVILSSLVGALQLSRVQGTEVYEQITAQLLHELKA
jgi:TetR/AcrR family transcriptional repressor of nem operon